MRKFDVLFDQGESSPIEDAGYGPYGRLGFPPAPSTRPWIFSNFVQSLDGIASWKGRHPLGSDISQSEEDRWLMDLLRAHAHGILLGVNTLIQEAAAMGPKHRGPIYRVDDPELQQLRARLGRGRDKNIFVTGAGALKLSDFAVFDNGEIDTAIVTTRSGAARLAGTESRPHVRIIIAGDDRNVDLHAAMRVLHEQLGVRYLLCEGGPTLYGFMSRAGLVDEKFVTVSPVEAGQIIPPE